MWALLVHRSSAHHRTHKAAHTKRDRFKGRRAESKCRHVGGDQARLILVTRCCGCPGNCIFPLPSSAIPKGKDWIQPQLIFCSAISFRGEGTGTKLPSCQTRRPIKAHITRSFRLGILNRSSSVVAQRRTPALITPEKQPVALTILSLIHEHPILSSEFCTPSLAAEDRWLLTAFGRLGWGDDTPLGQLCKVVSDQPFWNLRNHTGDNST